MTEAPSILHVDLDAFFASVEQLLDPTLQGRPVIVGGTGNRGVVAAASYEARRFGVHSALPTARARRLCPGGVFLTPRIGLYREYSEEVFAIFHGFTPLVEPVSLDEAFLEVGGARRLFGDGPEIAAAIKQRVRETVGLVCSVGVATTKLLAKLASDASKPDGLLVVEPGRELAFLHPMPVGRLWGVGPATRAKLDRVAVKTVGDLAGLSQDSLVRLLGKAAGSHLHALAWNRDERPVTPGQLTKSVSSEETFARDLVQPDDLGREVRRLAHRTALRLREGPWAGRTVTLKVRFSDFQTITRSVTLKDPTDSDVAIMTAVVGLLDKVEAGPGIRLLGVGISNLEEAAHRQESFPLEGRTASVDAAVDAVRERFGDDAVAPAALVERDGLRTGRRTDHSWGPDAPRTEPPPTSEGN